MLENDLFAKLSSFLTQRHFRFCQWFLVFGVEMSITLENLLHLLMINKNSCHILVPSIVYSALPKGLINSHPSLHPPPLSPQKSLFQNLDICTSNKYFGLIKLLKKQQIILVKYLHWHVLYVKNKLWDIFGSKKLIKLLSLLLECKPYCLHVNKTLYWLNSFKHAAHHITS